MVCKTVWSYKIVAYINIHDFMLKRLPLLPVPKLGNLKVNVMSYNTYTLILQWVLYALKLVDIKTGEEDEDVMYKQRARLYRYAKNLSVWKARGIGDLKLMRHRETGALRLLMRREQVRWDYVL